MVEHNTATHTPTTYSHALHTQVGTDLKVIVFPKSDLDKANKDTGKHYPPSFEVQMYINDTLTALSSLTLIDLS